MTAEGWLAPVDVRLLRELAREPNVVRASRALGITRDRAVYRLRRLSALYGGPVSRGHRGRTGPGSTELTPLGRRLLRRASGLRPGSNRWTGTFTAHPSPLVVVGPRASLEVAFWRREGASVTVEIDPEAFVVAPHRVRLSARNALAVRIERITSHPDDTALLHARWQGRPVRVALTIGSVARLGLKVGGRAYLYAKAVAVRPVHVP